MAVVPTSGQGIVALIVYIWDHIRERELDLWWHEGGVLRLLGNVKKAAESLVTLG